MPGAKYRSLKDPELYEKLREQGYSKMEAARISNAAARKKKRGRKKAHGRPKGRPRSQRRYD